MKNPTKFCFLLWFCFSSLGLSGQNNFTLVVDRIQSSIQRLKIITRTPASTPCGMGELVVTKDINGRLVSEILWYNGRRCGTARIYDRGVIAKIVEFYFGIVLSYKSFRNGVVVTEISKDRSRIVSQGRLLTPNWDKAYIPVSNSKLMLLKRNEIIDILSLFALPEEVGSFLEGMNAAAENSIRGDRSFFTCGQSISSLKDVETDLKSGVQSKKSQAMGSIRDKVNNCTSNLGTMNSGGLSGSAGFNERKSRIDQANTNIDKMVSSCADSERNSLISDPEDDVWQQARPYIGPAMQGLKAAARSEVTQVVLREGGIIRNAEVAVNGARVLYLGGEAVVTTVGAPAAAATSIGLLPALGVVAAAAGIGLVVDFVVEAVIDNHFDKEDEALNAATEEEMMKIRSGTKQGEHSEPTKVPIPGESDGGSKCDRLNRLKDRCNANGWMSWDCQEALNFFGGRCTAYDPKEVMTSENGDFSGGNCSDFKAADKAKMECKKLGMFAIPGNKGGFSCIPAVPVVDLPSLLHTDWYINPMPVDAYSFLRGSVGEIFSQRPGVIAYDEISSSKLNEIIRLAKKPTMVVFMDPDCPACKSFSNSIMSKQVADILSKGIEIIVVDAAANPELISSFDVLGYPSYFLKKASGTFTPMSIGATSPDDLVKYLLLK